MKRPTKAMQERIAKNRGLDLAASIAALNGGKQPKPKVSRIAMEVAAALKRKL